MNTFTLPQLSFSPEELLPHISETTIHLHHGKHLATYINNLNKLIEGTEFENSSLEDIILKANGGLYNNAAQTWNHIFYFEQFISQPEPIEGKLANEIIKKWDSIENFIRNFNNNALTLFGSGWVWLVIDNNKELQIVKSQDAGNPMTKGFTPLLTIDVWEHAYYMDYQNRRAEYINNFWEVVNWKFIEKRFNDLITSSK